MVLKVASAEPSGSLRPLRSAVRSLSVLQGSRQVLQGLRCRHFLDFREKQLHDLWRSLDIEVLGGCLTCTDLDAVTPSGFLCVLPRLGKRPRRRTCPPKDIESLVA
jgi:hypothetical protein